MRLVSRCCLFVIGLVAAMNAQEPARPAPTTASSPKLQAWAILDNGVANSSYEKLIACAVATLTALIKLSRKSSIGAPTLADPTLTGVTRTPGSCRG